MVNCGVGVRGENDTFLYNEIRIKRVGASAWVSIEFFFFNDFIFETLKHFLDPEEGEYFNGTKDLLDMLIAQVRHIYPKKKLKIDFVQIINLLYPTFFYKN